MSGPPEHPELLEFVMPSVIDGATDFNLDGDQVGILPTTLVNLHLTAECNFFSGSYQQPTADTGDINSNVTVNKTAIVLANYRPATTADVLPVGITIQGSDQINTAVSRGTGSLGDVANFGDAGAQNTAVAKDMLDIVSLSLFNRKEKYAAIRNDLALINKVSTGTNDVLDNHFTSEDTDYTGSKFFPRYLDSGRYDASTASEADDSTVQYNFNDARLHFIVRVQGSLADPDAEEGQSGISSDLSDAVDRGNANLYMGRAFPSRLTEMIDDQGAYDFNVLFTLVQNDDLKDGQSTN